MNIVIIGAGETGQHLAKVLATEGHHITVVDRAALHLARLEDQLDIKVIEGHGASATVLREAGAWEADLVLAVTNNDEVNMLAAYFAHSQGAKRTIVRMDSAAFLERQRHFYKSALGVDSILVPDELCAQEIIELVHSRQAVAVESFADGQIQMRRVLVDDASPWAGSDLAKIKLPKQTLVTAVIRGEEIMIPHGGTALEAGDELLIIGRTQAMDGLDKLGSSRRKKESRLVVLVGGGDLGLSLARFLERSGVRLKLVEEDPERAKHLAGALDRVTVVQGDGMDVGLLREIGADHADVFVSTCGDDEKNLMGCQLAKNLGAKKTIALVKKPDYVSIYHRLGVDAAVSPRLLVAQHILRYVRIGAIASIAVIAEGKAEVIEMKAREGSKIAGAPLSKVGFPRGAVIGSVLREGKVIIPDGDFQIEPGDDCIIFTFLETLPLIEKYFTGKKKTILDSIAGAL